MVHSVDTLPRKSSRYAIQPMLIGLGWYLVERPGRAGTLSPLVGADYL